MLTVAQPEEPYLTNPTQLLALCLWRESRGESIAAKLGVAWVILNRTRMAPAQGFKHSIAENILHPGAFSSFLQGDPNATKYPQIGDPSWGDCLSVAEAMGLSDPTFGACFYFSPPLTEPPVHQWGPVERTAVIGHLQFYKVA